MRRLRSYKKFVTESRTQVSLFQCTCLRKTSSTFHIKEIFLKGTFVPVTLTEECQTGKGLLHGLQKQPHSRTSQVGTERCRKEQLPESRLREIKAIFQTKVTRVCAHRFYKHRTPPASEAWRNERRNTHLMGGRKATQPDTSQRFPATGREVMNTNQNAVSSVQTH